MKIMVGALIGMLVLTLGQVAGQRAPDSVAVEINPPTFDYWMEVKLDESQKVFAALAKGDFVAIARSTEKLRKVNTLEGFVRRNPVEYRTQLRSFEFAIDEIAKQAKNENIEGVALGFQQLTLSCVNCHKHLRQNPTEVVR